MSKKEAEKRPTMDEVLHRMLATPPEPHASKPSKPSKPKAKSKKKKPA